MKRPTDGFDRIIVTVMLFGKMMNKEGKILNTTPFIPPPCDKNQLHENENWIKKKINAFLFCLENGSAFCFSLLSNFDTCNSNFKASYESYLNPNITL